VLAADDIGVQNERIFGILQLYLNFAFVDQLHSVVIQLCLLQLMSLTFRFSTHAVVVAADDIGVQIEEPSGMSAGSVTCNLKPPG
jgi:hypothetical protein